MRWRVWCRSDAAARSGKLPPDLGRSLSNPSRSWPSAVWRNPDSVATGASNATLSTAALKTGTTAAPMPASSNRLYQTAARYVAGCDGARPLMRRCRGTELDDLPSQ